MANTQAGRHFVRGGSWRTEPDAHGGRKRVPTFASDGERDAEAKVDHWIGAISS